MDERYIMAVDLGTSKIAVTVAKVEGDNIQIVYCRETPSDGINYSRVNNPTRAGKAIKNAISLAEKELGIVCRIVVAGYPKYEVKQKKGSFKTSRNEADCMTAEDIRNLKSLAMQEYPLDEEAGEVLLGAVAQSFNVDEDQFQILESDIVGMAMKEIEGNFKIFIGQSKYVNNMDTAFKEAGNVCVGRKYFVPEAEAKAVLFDTEMENGVAMIDFGAGVTTVSIYHGNIMRYYAAIPFGGRSITMDIKNELACSEKLAENIKLAYGACMPDRLQNLGDKTLLISFSEGLPSKQVAVKYISQIITARATEIVEAVLYEIQRSGFADNLKSGVVITGGGANLCNLSTLIKEISGYSVRVGYPRKVFSAPDDYKTSSAASLGMILMSKDDIALNCAVPAENAMEEAPVVEEGTVAEGEQEEENVFSPMAGTRDDEGRDGKAGKESEKSRKKQNREKRGKNVKNEEEKKEDDSFGREIKNLFSGIWNEKA